MDSAEENRVRAIGLAESRRRLPGSADAATATTPAAAGPPAAPSSVTAAAASSSQIDVAWLDNASNETSFQIARCTGTTCTPVTVVGSAGANATSYADTGRAANTTYRYRVRAVNASGNSTWSTPIASATTPPLPVPGGLTATAVSSTQIDLAWTETASNETGFQIQRCAGVGCTTWAQIAALGRT